MKTRCGVPDAQINASAKRQPVDDGPLLKRFGDIDKEYFESRRDLSAGVNEATVDSRKRDASSPQHQSFQHLTRAHGRAIVHLTYGNRWNIVIRPAPA